MQLCGIAVRDGDSLAQLLIITQGWQFCHGWFLLCLLTPLFCAPRGAGSVKKNWGKQLFHTDIQSYSEIHVMALGSLLPYKCLSFSVLSLYSSQGMYYQEDVL